MFKKKTNTNVPDGKPQASEKVKTPSQRGKSFMQAAQAFEVSEVENTKKRERIAWRICGVFGLITVLSVGAVIALAPLKTVEPFVLRVDKNTGVTDVVTMLEEKELSIDEVMDKYWLSTYVKNRESYDWETIQSTYDTTNLLSSNIVQQQFQSLYNSEAAPQKILKNQYKVLVKVNNISFIGQTAQVRFEKVIVPVNPSTSAVNDRKVENMIATIAFTYETKKKQTEAVRLINPLGFQVTSYRVDIENIQTSE